MIKTQKSTNAKVSPQEKEKQERNKSTFEGDKLKNACEKAGIPITKRQASKFNNKKGIAYTVSRGGKYAS